MFFLSVCFGTAADRRVRASQQRFSVQFLFRVVAMVMLLTTLLTPLTSVTSLVTRLFSAAFLAMPLNVTTPSVVSTFVFRAPVEWCDNNDILTWAVMDASSIFSP